MSTPKTIDDRIRAKAEEKWKAEVDKIFEPVHRLLQIGHCLSTEIPKVDAHDAIKAAKRAITAYYLPRKQEMAVEEFMGKVEELHKQIGELRGEYAE